MYAKSIKLHCCRLDVKIEMAHVIWHLSNMHIIMSRAFFFAQDCIVVVSREGSPDCSPGRHMPNSHVRTCSIVFFSCHSCKFQGGTSFVDLLCFVLSCVCYVFVCVCLYVLCGHLLGKGWPLGSRLWCLLWVCHFPIGILGQVWYLIASIPDLCTLTYLGGIDKST